MNNSLTQPSREGSGAADRRRSSRYGAFGWFSDLRLGLRRSAFPGLTPQWPGIMPAIVVVAAYSSGAVADSHRLPSHRLGAFPNAKID